MKKNMGLIDRSIRTLFAITVIILYFAGMITGTAAIVLGIFSLIFLATSALGFCPLYLPFGISTRRKDE